MKRLVLFLLLGLLAGMGWWLFRPNDAERAALQVRTLATRTLGEFLATTRAGQRVLVISNPFIRSAGTPSEIVEMEAAGVRGIKEGLGGKLTLAAVAFPELKPAARIDPRSVPMDGDTTTPLSYLVAPDAFDQLVRQHEGCGVIVSLIGLPAELERVACWRATGPPDFALLLPDLRIIGDVEAVRSSFKSGKLLAIVLNKPGAPDSDARLGKDFAAEFARRFVLVTPENFEQVLRDFPQLFPRQ